jgi:hypothetical protein
MPAAVWIPLALSIVALVTVALLVPSWRRGRFDLGSVSEQWMAEHRANPPGERVR